MNRFNGLIALTVLTLGAFSLLPDTAEAWGGRRRCAGWNTGYYPTYSVGYPAYYGGGYGWNSSYAYPTYYAPTVYRPVTTYSSYSPAYPYYGYASQYPTWSNGYVFYR
ncbi:MAG: hypothetical protein U0840_10410 [Gemmataceae bacterium]